MIIRSKTLCAFGVLLASVWLAGAAPANSLRYLVEEDFTAAGPDADARGHAQVLVKQKGASHIQRLRVTLANLDPGTPYQLLATTGDDTNFFAVADFTTTAAGRATVMQQRVQAKDKIRRTAPKRVLAEPLAPLTEVRTLAVANTNGEVVLTVDLHAAPALQFELTSVFQSTGVDAAAVGCLVVAVQKGGVQFRLFAAGQSPQLKFHVNDSLVGTYAADFAGRINVGFLPYAAPSPLAFRTMSVRNAVDDLVLKSTVP